uniref:Integrase core domain containing protein n=1 Tax=Solanum tuberosum TaxID=4113 RepID=M1DMY4_SOLTU
MNNQGVLGNPIGGNSSDVVGLQPLRVGDENNLVQDLIHEIPSTDRRSGSWSVAQNNSTKCGTTEMDYSSAHTWFPSKPFVLGLLTYGGDPWTVATLRGSIHRNDNPRAQTPLKKTVVHGFSVDISEITIRQFLYSPSHTWALNTAKFDYKWGIVRGGKFQRSAEKKEIVLHWLARYMISGLIRDEANVAAPRREPQVDVPPLGADLVDNVKQIQGDDPAPPTYTDDAPTSPSQVVSRPRSSCRATPPSGAIVVPLARVQKLEDQMATLLHHVKPWMKKSNVESEIFPLSRPSWTVSEPTLMPSLSHPQISHSTAPTALADDTVLDVLFSDDIAQPEPTRVRGKRHLSSHISDTTEDARARKRERQ